MKQFTFTKNKLFGLICSALLPLMAIVLGCLMLTKGVVFNLGFVVAYFLIPLGAIGLMAWFIFSKPKAWKSSVLCGVVLVAFLILFFYFSLMAGWTKIKHYEGHEATQRYSAFVLESKTELMPALSETGTPEKTEYYNVYSSFAIFTSETNYLICRYTPQEYELQKARLETNHTFRTEQTPDKLEPTADIDGYHFRMLSSGDEEYDNHLYPKKIVLIGCSDDNNEIVYLEFYDFDLDFIRSLEEFILDDCGWKHIR